MPCNIVCLEFWFIRYSMIISCTDRLGKVMIRARNQIRPILIMQSIYGFIAVSSVAILLLLNVVTFAIPPDDSAASRLGRTPDSWELVVDRAKWNGIDQSALKTQLVSFLTKTHMPIYKVVSSVSLTLVACFFFSCIGWIRERNWKRHDIGADK